MERFRVCAAVALSLALLCSDERSEVVARQATTGRVALLWQTNARLTQTVVENMEASQLRFAEIDDRLRREHILQAMALGRDSR
jgi:hypothetical protein